MNIFEALDEYGREQKKNQRRQRITTALKNICYGCAIPILLFIVLPVALVYAGGWFFTETSIGQILGDI